jgi:hypothetical protein
MTVLTLKSSLEIGSAGTTCMASTLANPFSGRVKTAFESVQMSPSRTAQSLSAKSSLISVQSVLGRFKNFIESIKPRSVPNEIFIEMTDMSDKSKVSIETYVEAFENEPSAPSALSRFAFTVLEKTTNVVDFKAAVEKADAVFVKVKEIVDVLETPLEFVTVGLEWAALVEVLEHHAETIKNVVEEAAAPLVLISLIAKVKKVHKAFFGPKVEGAEAPKTSELVSMGFSLAATLCTTISWLQKIGVLTPAVAVAGRLTLIGSLFNLVIAVIDLGENIRNYKGAAKLLKALLNMAVAIATTFLLVYAVSHLPLLLLMLATGILILNIAFPDKEDEDKKEHVKEVQ